MWHPVQKICDVKQSWESSQHVVPTCFQAFQACHDFVFAWGLDIDQNFKISRWRKRWITWLYGTQKSKWGGISSPFKNKSKENSLHSQTNLFNNHPVNAEKKMFRTRLKCADVKRGSQGWGLTGKSQHQFVVLQIEHVLPLRWYVSVVHVAGNGDASCYVWLCILGSESWSREEKKSCEILSTNVFQAEEIGFICSGKKFALHTEASSQTTTLYYLHIACISIIVFSLKWPTSTVFLTGKW